MAFGGAGGLHACALAEALGSSAVLFPVHAGVLSALGALAGGSRRERSRSVLLDAGDAVALERAWLALEREVRAEFGRAERGEVALERWAEMRYRGQSHEVPVRGGADLAGRFHREHERRYGFGDTGRAVEVVTLEVRGSTPTGWGHLARPAATAPTGSRPGPGLARARIRGRWVNAVVRPRQDMPEARGGRASRGIHGPAIVIDEGATLWVAPGWSARAHPNGTIVVTRGARR